MSMCKAICAKCRFGTKEGPQWRCYYETEVSTDCVTGEVTYSSDSCHVINIHGDCEDFEHRPPPPVKKMWSSWDDLEWDPIKGSWIKC
jgi:hypothetical protein